MEAKAGDKRGGIAGMGKVDKLEEIFRLQAELNDRIADEHNLCTQTAQFQNDKDVEARGHRNLWLLRFARALQHEVTELEDSCIWKWWSQDKCIDLHNVRVEIIDMLHFWVSLALVAGMSADDVYRIYCEKNLINHERQERGYSKETKTDDNIGIDTGEESR